MKTNQPLILKALSFFALPFFVALAHADGERGGNGGNAVVCRDSLGHIKSARLLDLYEGEKMLDAKFIKTSAHQETLLNILEQTKKYQKDFGALLSSEALKILESIEKPKSESAPFVKMTDDPLSGVTDSFHLTLPSDCKIEQAAIRLSDEQSLALKGIKYAFQEQIWKALDEESKVGLVLHEAIYKIMNQKTSLLTRALVRTLLDSHDFNFITLTQSLWYLDFIFLVPASGIRNYGTSRVVLDQKNNTITLEVPSTVPVHLVYDQNGNIIQDLTSFGPLHAASNNFRLQLNSRHSRHFTEKMKLMKGLRVQVNGVAQKINVHRIGSLITSEIQIMSAPFDEITVNWELNSPGINYVLSIDTGFGFYADHKIYKSLSVGYQGPTILLFYPELRVNN
jgi:hypothetical protein